jgi:hypothetical protein
MLWSGKLWRACCFRQFFSLRMWTMVHVLKGTVEKCGRYPTRVRIICENGRRISTNCHEVVVVQNLRWEVGGGWRLLSVPEGWKETDLACSEVLIRHSGATGTVSVLRLGCGLDYRGSFPARDSDGIFIFATASKLSLGAIHSPIQWVPGVKRPKREADCTPPSSATVKNALSCTASPPIRLHGAVRTYLWPSTKVKGKVGPVLN